MNLKQLAPINQTNKTMEERIGITVFGNFYNSSDRERIRGNQYFGNTL
jgi:hypothetical protein